MGGAGWGGTFPNTSASHCLGGQTLWERSSHIRETFPVCLSDLHHLLIRPSPWNLPPSSSSGLPLGKVLPRFGEGLVSPRAPSSQLWPSTALGTILSGEGLTSFVRPSPFASPTFPVCPSDLPHGISLPAAPVAFLLGKVPPRFGEGPFSPRGTFLTTLALHSLGNHSLRGRSRLIR